MDMLTLFTVFGAVLFFKEVAGSKNRCPQSSLKILNGLETSPDPLTVMSASSALDRFHTAHHGLAFGSTGWSPRRAEAGEWMEADIGSHAYVSQVRVYLLAPGVRVKVEAGVNSETQSPRKVLTEKRLIKAEFNPPVLASHIRLTVTDFYDEIELEMMVIGCNRRRGVVKEHRLY